MAISQFNSKFSAKTRGGYTEIEISYEAEDESKPAKSSSPSKAGSKAPVKKKESKLDKRVQELIKLICDLTILNKTLSEIGYDAKKMPLGKLSENTLKKGFGVLKQMEKAIKGKSTTPSLTELSSRFYTLIPHDFGFQHMSNFVIRTPK
jgi:poly [ADP-ribose] polymerase